jgi:glycerophosphoryl diester phosphodiesterase
LGLSVIPWTVDDANDMRALIADGVDGIITNYPARLRAVLAELGMPLPPPYRR